MAKKKKKGKSFLRRKYSNFSEVQIIILNLLPSLLPTVVKFSTPEITWSLDLLGKTFFLEAF